MRANISERVQKHRAALRASGMRPIQIWVPDTRAPGFAEECRRQSLLASASDQADAGLIDFLDEVLADEALADVNGWKA